MSAGTLSRDFGAAYGGLAKVLGIALGAVAIFNWLMRAFTLSPSSIFEALLAAYHQLFDPLFEVLFGWLPFAIPPEWKDGLVLWVVLGGGVARSLWILRQTQIETEDTDESESSLLLPKNLILFALVLVVANLLWPLFLPAMFMAPFVYRATVHHYRDEERFGGIFGGVFGTTQKLARKSSVTVARKTLVESNWTSGKTKVLHDMEYKFDLRMVWFFQVVGLIVASAALVLANAASA